MSKKKHPLINREISWLKFNERVFQEAIDDSTPLLERLKFLGIYSNNLDEFYRVRVATLTRMIELKSEAKSKLSFSPEKILGEIYLHETAMQKRFTEVYHEILHELEKQGIFIIDENGLNEEQSAYVKDYFRSKVRPNLFPLMLKNIRNLDLLKDKSVYLAVSMYDSRTHAKAKNYALVKVPVSTNSRFLILPSKDNINHVMLLDDVLRHCMGEIFNTFNYDTFNAYTIKFSRDAELEIDNDVDKSFLDNIAQSLKQRKRGKPVRFVYDRAIPRHMLETILKKLKIQKKDAIVPGDRYHNFKDFMDFPEMDMPALYYEKLPPLLHPLINRNGSIFKLVAKRDIMLNFPYHSFSHIIDLLREASIDPKVETIKMTIYRVAKNSNVINALINAARNGKKVTVFLELLARFDEEANIFWSRAMAEEGVTVLHGNRELKVHSKLILIKRRERGKLVMYANVGTGNFNESTARVYADNSLLTSDKRITLEADAVFTIFEMLNNKSLWLDSKNIKNDLLKLIKANNMLFKNLIMSPFSFRKKMLQYIQTETSNAKNGLKAQIILKLNSLVDEAFANKLYEAATAGVDVKIIARGICVMVPGKEKFNKNIQAISIVDRFLEHSRIYCFYNNGDEKFFISSADIMTRNIDHRIEVTCPIYDERIKSELREILNIQLNDNVKARYLGDYQCNMYKDNKDQTPLRTQTCTYNYYKNKS